MGPVSAVEYIVILDKCKQSLQRGLEPKRYKIISNYESFHSFLSESPKFIGAIILVEINWEKEINGYDIADQLLFDAPASRNIDVLFISYFSRQELYNIYDHNKNSHVYIRKFQHKEIADKDFDLNAHLPDHWSDRKFNYIKNYYFKEGGVLQTLIHETTKLAADYSKGKLSSYLKNLDLYKNILPEEVISKIDDLNKLPDKKKLDAIVHLRTLLEKELYTLPGQDGASQHRIKSKHKIMLIEDDAKTMAKLAEQFGYYYENITQMKSGTEAYEELSSNGMSYDAVITDMALLEPRDDGLEFDDAKIGVDILELCESKCPHMVTRVISGLPKNALKDLINKDVSEMIYKSDSPNYVIPPHEDLDNFVKNINAEIKVKRKFRGDFPELFCFLGQYVSKLGDSERESLFKKLCKRAGEFLELEPASTVPENKKIDANFGRKTNVKSRERWELIILHRLIVLGYSKGKAFDFDKFARHHGFVDGMHSKSSKDYFNLRLGLSVAGAKSNRNEECMCKVNLRCLLDEEINWLDGRDDKITDSMLLIDADSDFFDMLQETMNYIYEPNVGNYIGDDIKIVMAREEAMNLDEELLTTDKKEHINSNIFDKESSTIEKLCDPVKDIWNILKEKTGYMDIKEAG